MTAQKATSEQRFNIAPQPPEMCPRIDTVIDNVKGVMEEINYESRTRGHTERDELETKLKDIESLSDFNISVEMEEIRDLIISLRAWGEEWKEFAKYLFDKYGDSRDI